jgi:hypothetical protein
MSTVAEHSKVNTQTARGKNTPVKMLWLLAFVALVTAVFSAWGLWRITDLAMQFQNKDDRAMVVAVNLKEQIGSFSKLTYDFLLQQEFNRMLMKEKQSNQTRVDITQSLTNLDQLTTTASAVTVIESIRYNVAQFLTLTDKALETAVEDGSATKARVVLQDEVEPALRVAQESLNMLVNSRQKFNDEHFQYVRQQAIMGVLLLVGLTTLGMAIFLSLRSALVKPVASKQFVPTSTALTVPSVDVVQVDEYSDVRKKNMEARSLTTLALINRLNRLHKESEDLKKEVQTLQRHTSAAITPHRSDIGEKQFQDLQFQGEKIAMAVGRIQNVNDQTRHFVDAIGDLMHGMQGLATDGNVVALNVTIELAKLQAQMGGIGFPDEKNKKISDQIRVLATTAAGITGKMAMILSQFRYAQDDFARQTDELVEIKNVGADALEHIKSALHVQQQQSTQLLDERGSLTSHLPQLAQKIAMLEEQITQIQAMAEEEIDELADMPSGRQFKIISGGAA